MSAHLCSPGAAGMMSPLLPEQVLPRSRFSVPGWPSKHPPGHRTARALSHQGCDPEHTNSFHTWRWPGGSAVRRYLPCQGLPRGTEQYLGFEIRAYTTQHVLLDAILVPQEMLTVHIYINLKINKYTRKPPQSKYATDN